MSQLATSLSVLFKPPVQPADLQGLLTPANTAVAALVAYAGTISVGLGETYRNQILGRCELLLLALINHANGFLSTPVQVDLPIAAAHVATPYLARTGLVWDAASAFDALPATNLEAVVAAWKTAAAVLDDAVEELKGVLERPRRPEPAPPAPAAARDQDQEGDQDDSGGDDDDDDEYLTAREAAVASDGLRLLRMLYVLSRTIVVKVVTPFTSAAATDLAVPLHETLVSWLDHVAHAVGKLSSAFDNLTIALSPPQDGAGVRAAVADARVLGKDLLDLTAAPPVELAAACTAERAWLDRIATEFDALLLRLVPEPVLR